jgi:hypothetical protein
MFDCGNLPEENEDLSGITVDIPRLNDDTMSSCPVGLDELLDYLELEVPNGGSLKAEDLLFLRTAELGDARYWIWSFREPDGGELAYATVRLDPNGTQTRGYRRTITGSRPSSFSSASTAAAGDVGRGLQPPDRDVTLPYTIRELRAVPCRL